jgi:hypothetical protein
LLVEEEKFRKGGKKKYEVLSERMLQLFAKLNALTSGDAAATGAAAAATVTTTGSSMPHIDVRPSFGGLSSKGKGLLKGRFKERIELMHLQLSSASAAANAAVLPSPPAVSASSASFGATPPVPAPSVVAGSTNSSASTVSAGPQKTSLGAAGAAGAAAKKVTSSAIPQNVFEFATNKENNGSN